MSGHSTHVTTLIAEGNSEKLAEIVQAHTGATKWLKEGVACDLYHSAEAPKLDVPVGFDVVTQPVAHREKSLLISDMDSTMIEQECIDELADYMGIKDQVSDITERAMNGELPFKAALKERIALLKGLPHDALEEVFASRITLMPGSRRLLRTMNERGVTCILVSGGFTFFTSRVADLLGFEAHFANKLAFEDDKLTGEVVEPILGKEAKVETLEQCCQEKGIAIEDTLAVGDGANDVPMLLMAAMGVAYHAKPVVQQSARAAINYHDLSALLYIQGIPHSDWVQ